MCWGREPLLQHSSSSRLFLSFWKKSCVLTCCILCPSAQNRLALLGGGGGVLCFGFGGNPAPNSPLLSLMPSLGPVAGHKYTAGLLPQAMSPDGEAIVTGAGDETLRFWNVFSKTRSTKVKWVGISARCFPRAHPLGLSWGLPPLPPEQPCSPDSAVTPPRDPCTPVPTPASLCTPSRGAQGPREQWRPLTLLLCPKACFPRLQLSFPSCVPCRNPCPFSTSSPESGKPWAEPSGQRSTTCHHMHDPPSPHMCPEEAAGVGGKPGPERP